MTYHDGQYYNLGPDKKGWWISSIETDKQVGSVPEFIEKEGKWFNYVKGKDSDISETTDFGAFDIQGIGFLESISGSTLTFTNNVNTSLQIGDTIYYQNASNTTTLGGFDTINPNEIVKFGQVTEITSNTVTIDETVFGGGNIPDPTHGAFILFVKNQVINTSSLLGYYADVKFENNSKTKVELFSVGSEISESSK